MPIIRTTKRLRPRDPHDHYPTPLALCHAALKYVYDPQPIRRICDPGAGTGVWGMAARARWPKAEIVGAELRMIDPPPVYDDWFTGHYLTADLGMFDLVMGNPPYALAEPFVRRALGQLRPDGTLIFLLRLAFLAGDKRGRGLWRDYPPIHVAVCSRRPSFMGNGKTDATDYGLFIWRRGWTGPPVIDWLDWGRRISTALQDEMFLEGVA